MKISAIEKKRVMGNKGLKITIIEKRRKFSGMKAIHF
jgi:hypothetical protein